MLMKQAATVLSPWGTGLGQADVSRDNGCGKRKMAGGGSIPPPAQRRLYRPQRWVPLAALRRVCRFLEALPCGLLLEVFDGCSSVSRRLSPRERAIARELSARPSYFEIPGDLAAFARSESCDHLGHEPGVTSTSFTVSNL